MAKTVSPLISSLLFVFSATLIFSAPTAAKDSARIRIDPERVADMSKALADKGYLAMSMTLQATIIDSLIAHSNATRVTILAPQDAAFFSSKYPRPRLGLLRYISPRKLSPETMESALALPSLPLGAKVETLLHGDPLVMDTREVMNGVEIVDWDLYNDGQVIVHGVKDCVRLRKSSISGVNITQETVHGLKVASPVASRDVGPQILWWGAALCSLGMLLYLGTICCCREVEAEEEEEEEEDEQEQEYAELLYGNGQ